MKRQGDLFFTQTTSKEGRLDRSGVILRGESTGHSHKLTSGKLYRSKESMFVVSDGKTKVVHEEHNSISLGKGIWLVRRQREYMSKDMVRVVVD